MITMRELDRLCNMYLYSAAPQIIPAAGSHQPVSLELAQQFQAALRETRATLSRAEEEIRRLREIAAAAGSAQLDTAPMDSLRLTLHIGRHVLYYAQSPEEVFQRALDQAMHEFRAHVRETISETNPLYRMTEAFADATKNIAPQGRETGE